MHVQSCCFGHKTYCFLTSLLSSSLGNCDVNENGKKEYGRFGLAKELCTCFALFWNFSLPSLHECDVRMPYFTFRDGREHKTTTFCSWASMAVFTSPEKIANICPMERDGICAIKFQKFEVVRIHFLSDVCLCCLSSQLYVGGLPIRFSS